MKKSLDRFVTAQRHVYGQVLAELRDGKKQSHWIWFIFPQIAGLGQSEISRRFAITDLAEAVSYMQHNILGPRLIECTDLVLACDGRTLDEIFGYPDNFKFHSSMTLFNAATTDVPGFNKALDKYFLGQRDSATVARISAPV